MQNIEDKPLAGKTQIRKELQEASCGLRLARFGKERLERLTVLPAFLAPVKLPAAFGAKPGQL